jgi:hypothetical protein
MLKTNRWNIGKSSVPGSQQTAVPSNYFVLCIDENRDVEAKRLDAARELLKLSDRVDPGVAWIHDKVRNSPIKDFELAMSAVREL